MSNRTYYQEHKEYFRKYHQEHKKKRNAYCRKYREEHREEIRKHSQEKKEETRQYNKKYQEEHKERISKAYKEYCQKIRKKALRILGNKCFFCKRSNKLEFHKKDGQPHRAGNALAVLKNPEEFALLCAQPCHRSVHFCFNVLAIQWEEIEERFFEQANLS